VLKVDSFGLLADVCTCDTLLEQQSVNEEEHQREEVPVEVVLSWLDLVRIEKHS